MEHSDNLPYKKIFETSFDAIVCSNEAGRITHWNSAAERMFAYNTSEILNQRITILIPAADQEKHQTAFKQFIRTGKFKTSGNIIKVSARKKDGQTLPIEMSLSADQTAQGWNFTAVLRDISKRIAHDKQMQHYKQQQKASSSLSLDALAGMKLDELFQKTTHVIADTLAVKYCKVLELQADGTTLLLRAGVGWKQGLVGNTTVGTEFNSQAGFTLQSQQPVIVDDLRSEQRFDGQGLLRDHHIISGISVVIEGTHHPWGVLACHTSTRRSFSHDDIQFIQTLANILALAIERKQSDTSLHKLSQAIEYAGESILITDRNGIIEYINPAFTNISGYSAQEAIGQTPRILNSGNQDKAFYKSMWEHITSGKTWHGKVIDKNKNGDFYPAMLTIAPIMDAAGDITHFVGTHADLTDLDNMEKQFHQAQKMEAIGTLVGGIAHDFNNMLAGITGNIFLAKQMQNNSSTLQKLDNIEQLSFRAADMIKQLLTFARKDRVEIKPLPFTSFIKETLKFLSPTIPENINVKQNICMEHLSINGDATQLHQILMNLINNARDAVEKVSEPCISIQLDFFHADAGYVKKHAYFKSGSYAHVSIGDNGCGIAKNKIEHIFEPFFTTKEEGKGTGLGLAMAFGAIKTHAGYIQVESRPHEGSTFHIFIPLLAEAKTQRKVPHALKESKAQGELILLADDEQHVREITAEVLETMGYKVLQACDGLDAIELFKVHAEDIDLALLDVVMPRCGGLEAAMHMRENAADLPIIFLTGYDKEHVFEKSFSLKSARVLTKPIQFERLNRIIQKQLNTAL